MKWFIFHDNLRRQTGAMSDVLSKSRQRGDHLINDSIVMPVSVVLQDTTLHPQQLESSADKPMSEWCYRNKSKHCSCINLFILQYRRNWELLEITQGDSAWPAAENWILHANFISKYNYKSLFSYTRASFSAYAVWVVIIFLITVKSLFSVQVSGSGLSWPLNFWLWKSFQVAIERL